jgi:hypothetical protein
VLVLLSVPVLALPLVDLLPDHPPDALQLVALLEDQLSVEDPPLLMLVGFALKLTVGLAGADTLTVTDRLALPPEPVQVSVYVVVALSALVLQLPLVDSLPVHPPEALQLVALLEDQLSMEVDPLLTVVGVADKATVGAGATGALTTILKGASELELTPSLTLSTMFEYVPVCVLLGVPERRPVAMLSWPMQACSAPRKTMLRRSNCLRSVERCTGCQPHP